MTLNQKLVSTIAVLWLGLIAIGVLGAWQIRASLIEARREQLKALISEGYTATDHFAGLAANKSISEEEAKHLALATLGAMRYGAGGYISVNDSKPIMLMHPFAPAMVGKDVSGF